MSKPALHIRKILLAVAWLAAAVVMVVVLVAAIKRTNDSNCNGASLKIRGAEKFIFLDKSDVWKLMGASGNNSFKGKPIVAFDLQALESKIRKNSWVSSAELFFDQDRILQIRIHEREPIARLFTENGKSYYLDSTGIYLPVAPGKPPVILPVITGMPDKLNLRKSTDSALLAGIKEITNVLQVDSFWMAQITQLNLNTARKFEMVPLIGNHIIYFGDGIDAINKFHHLGIFYKEVLVKTGFDYYSAIDVQFNRQVIGVKGPAISTSVDKKIVWGSFADTSLSPVGNNESLTNTASPILQSVRKTTVDPLPVLTTEKKRPKAVMKKSNH